MSNLSIVSFHDSTGAVVNNATTAADSKVLLPIISGAVTNCCPTDIQFVRLQLELDFVTLTPDFVGARSLK